MWDVNGEEQEQDSWVWRPEERPGCEALRDLSALDANEIPRVCQIERKRQEKDKENQIEVRPGDRTLS